MSCTTRQSTHHKENNLTNLNGVFLKQDPGRMMHRETVPSLSDHEYWLPKCYMNIVLCPMVALGYLTSATTSPVPCIFCYIASVSFIHVQYGTMYKRPEFLVYSRKSCSLKILHCYLGPVVVHPLSTCDSLGFYTWIHRSTGVIFCT